jgi:hypothetical protein
MKSDIREISALMTKSYQYNDLFDPLLIRVGPRFTTKLLKEKMRDYNVKLFVVDDDRVVGYIFGVVEFQEVIPNRGN